MLSNNAPYCTAIILAGGKASRFAKLGQLVPKALLPVSESQTFLSRLLDQLIEAQLDQIIISTSQENFDFFNGFTKRYLKQKGASLENKVKLFLNDKHVDGPVIALDHVLSTFDSELYLLCLGDIFYSTNPFVELISSIKAGIRRNSLLAYPTTNDEALVEGGIVCAQESLVKEIYKFFSDFSSKTSISASYKKYLWSGGALFDSKVKDDLHNFVQDSQDPVLESFLVFSLLQQREFFISPIDKFINVNSYADFLECVLKLQTSQKLSESLTATRT